MLGDIIVDIYHLFIQIEIERSWRLGVRLQITAWIESFLTFIDLEKVIPPPPSECFRNSLYVRLSYKTIPYLQLIQSTIA